MKYESQVDRRHQEDGQYWADIGADFSDELNRKSCRKDDPHFYAGRGAGMQRQ